MGILKCYMMKMKFGNKIKNAIYYEDFGEFKKNIIV